MRKKKINLLFVEDDTNLGFVIKDQLEHAGYQVSWALNGADGLKLALNQHFEIAVLDVMLPQMNGFELAEELVELKPELPFIFLTAKSMLDDKVRGLKLGRDYLCKPFVFKELELRLFNILQQEDHIPVKEEQTKFEVGKYQFDYVNQYLTLNGNEQKLTKKEADVLKVLCQHKNQVMNRELALKTIWGNDDYFNGRSMDVFISRIRKYLKEDENIQIINVHGVGFKLAIR
ncbi:MAG: response regulator transcription factor [Flavobacteriales bacterium]|nr:response regulator transcription factor [Flavobacteriales bacterium]